MRVYWDTCCLLKLYCRESDSSHFQEFLAKADDPPVTSSFTRSELFFAFQQKQMRGELGESIGADNCYRDLENDLEAGRIHLIPFGEDVEAEARRIAKLCYQNDPPIALRTLDGLHLATASLIHAQKIVSTDLRMNAAAKLIGLSTFAQTSP